MATVPAIPAKEAPIAADFIRNDSSIYVKGADDVSRARMYVCQTQTVL